MNREVFSSRGAKCGTCNQPISFFKMPNGSWCPCNPDGGDHFDQCRQDWFEEVKRNGVWFERKDRAGYLHQGKVVLTRIAALRIRGSNYKPSACECIPWEECSCGEAT